MGARIRRRDRAGWGDRPKRLEDGMRAPAVRGREGAAEGGADRGRLAPLPDRRGREPLGQPVEDRADMPFERQRRAVHAMRQRLGDDVDDRLVGRPGVAPALSHLDGVIAGQHDQVGRLDQRADQPIGLRREADAADDAQIVLRQQALALVGGQQRRAGPVDQPGKGAGGVLVDEVEPGEDERAARAGEQCHCAVEIGGQAGRRR